MGFHDQSKVTRVMVEKDREIVKRMMKTKSEDVTPVSQSRGNALDIAASSSVSPFQRRTPPSFSVAGFLPFGALPASSLFVLCRRSLF